MNELRENYSPETYCLNKTRSVYVSLDLKTSMLRLQTTTAIHVPKRCQNNESIPLPPFNDQKLYSIKSISFVLLIIYLRSLPTQTLY